MRHRWYDNMKMDLRDRGWLGGGEGDQGLDSSGQVGGFSEHGAVSLDSIKCGELLD
jgi:hypothetical protein